MSLRVVHLVFISCATILAAFFAAWAGGQYQEVHRTGYAVTAAGSAVAALALALYGTAFQRKTRRLS